jgi:proline iminopeptidase
VSSHADGRYVTAGGVRTWMEVEGAGDVVVLAGGGPGNGHAHYHPWFSALAEDRSVVYFDYLGTGRSDRLEGRGRYSIERYAEQVESLREHLGAERIALVGISFGGMPALEYTQRWPERVDRLVLSNAQVSAHTWQAGNIDAVNAALRSHFPERWRALLALRERGIRSLADEYQELFEDVLERLEWADPERRPQLTRDDFNAPNPDVYAALVGDDPEWEVTGTMAGFDPDLSTISAPTLVVSGRWDQLTSPAIADAAAAALPDARLHVFERSAHRPWAEQPEEYFTLVRSFLAG